MCFYNHELSLVTMHCKNQGMDCFEKLYWLAIGAAIIATHTFPALLTPCFE